MENLDMSYEELDNIKSKFVDYGTEGKIYKATDHSLYKIFNYCALNNLHNKIKKLEVLEKLQIPFLRNPIRTISCEGNIIGYEVEYDIEDETWWNTPLSKEEKIYLLKKLKKDLKILEDEGIIYGDLRDENILINGKTHEVSFCDVDNIQVGEYPIDISLNVLAFYVNRSNRLFDREAHIFMHNLFTLKELYYKRDNEYIDIMSTLENSSLEKFDIFNKEGKKAISDLAHMDKVKRLRPVYLIDNLKKVS